MLTFYSHSHNTWSTVVTKLETQNTRHLLSLAILLSKQQLLPYLPINFPPIALLLQGPTNATITPKEQKGP